MNKIREVGSLEPREDLVPPDEPLTLDSRKYLFLDDYVIDQMEGLKRTLHQPEKRGQVLKPDRFWENGRVSAKSAPIWFPDEGVYRWVYRCTGKDYTALAVSRDGIHWDKPCLGLMKYGGSKQNNLISNKRIFKVVHDPNEEDPDRQFKGISFNTPVTSGDLVNWEDAGGKGIPGGDSGSLTYDEERGRFLAPVKIRDQSKDSFRQFELVTSEDFRTWSDPQFFFGADEEDQRYAVDRIRGWLSDPGRPRPLFVEPPPHLGWKAPEEIRKLPKRRHSWNAQCNNISVFPYQGQYIALITLLYPTGSYLPNHQNTSAFFMVEIATTRDLKTWNRLREPFLEPARLDHGVVDNYERMLVEIVNRPIVVNDELWFYYTGGKAHQGFHAERGYHRGRYGTYMDGKDRTEESLSDLERKDIEAGRSGIYLAVLRLDGFVSLDGGAQGGAVITKPLQLRSGELFLNLSCSGSGSASVELLNESGEVIAVSRPLTGDDVRIRVQWEQSFELDSLVGDSIRLRIHLKRASLYGFWTE